MEYRRANESDAPSVVQMVNALIVELGGKALDTEIAESICLSLIKNPGTGEIFIAKTDDGATVGVCCISYQSAIRAAGRYAIVQEMFVTPEHRGQDIGAALLGTAVEAAQKAGCTVIELGTPMHGDRPARFYRRAGFEAVGARMRKTLVK